MKHIRIMIVCDFGIGTSIILKTILDDVLQKQDIKAETFTSDADTAVGQTFDCVITSQNFARLFIHHNEPLLVIDNFISKDEVETKVIPILKQLINE